MSVSVVRAGSSMRLMRLKPQGSPGTTKIYNVRLGPLLTPKFLERKFGGLQKNFRSFKLPGIWCRSRQYERQPGINGRSTYIFRKKHCYYVNICTRGPQSLSSLRVHTLRPIDHNHTTLSKEVQFCIRLFYKIVQKHCLGEVGKINHLPVA